MCIHRTTSPNSQDVHRLLEESFFFIATFVRIVTRVKFPHTVRRAKSSIRVQPIEIMLAFSISGAWNPGVPFDEVVHVVAARMRVKFWPFFLVITDVTVTDHSLDGCLKPSYSFQDGLFFLFI